ncbi:HTH-type transcriptional regulator MalT [compost metagenome]
MLDFGEALVTRTKFIVPPLKRTHMRRERLHRLLDVGQDLRVTLVMGGTGYGKSSLLVGYLHDRHPTALWYGIAERDADPQLFALHLAHLFQRAFPGVADRALSLLALPGGAAKQGLAAIEALADALLEHLDSETWVVLDDVHHLQGSEATLLLANHLISLRVPHLRLILASRIRPDLPGLARWRLQGDALFVEQTDLAFQPEEVEALFADVLGMPLDAPMIERLMAETEGWPIAIQLMSQNLRPNGRSDRLSGAEGAMAQHRGVAVPESRGSLRDLFDYLANEVFDRLSEGDRDFLLATAPLPRLWPEICRDLTGRDSVEALAALNERGVFLVPLGDGAYRYHHLFREFLRERLLSQRRLQEAHHAAAQALRARGELEEAIDHFLEAGEDEQAAEGMAVTAPSLVNQGRYARLESWLARLRPEILDRAPALAIHQGDACRLTSRFEEALDWYGRAYRSYADNAEGRSRAQASKALVYLDTVQPAKAEKHLEEALAETQDPGRRTELLVMLAENKLNQGDAVSAERLFREAREHLPQVAEHEARICLRTGRLSEARTILQAALAQPAPSAAGTKAHREAALVLSLIESLQGEPQAAGRLASLGLERAREQGALWTEAVALIRLGHALLVEGRIAEAEGAYQEAIALARTVGVSRLKVEPLMGLAFVAGRHGDLATAEAHLKDGLEIAQSTGDAWLCAMLGLAQGGIYVAHGDPRAERWLMQAQSGYERCGDPFGLALVTLWSARLAMTLGEGKAVLTRIRRVLEQVKRHDLAFLLSRPTLLGFADAEQVKAFAGSALNLGIAPALLMPWLGELGLAAEPPALREDALRIRTLGAFRVWRGQEEIGAKAWGREKARQLFHLFLAHRGQMLPKPRIIDMLWPELDLAAADGTFRVALNALNKVLEPERKGGSPRFIVKEGATYGLRVGPDVWFDAAEFERLLDEAQAMEALGENPVELYRRALELSEGAFLADYPQYEAWCERERERLADRYKEGALKLARGLYAHGDDEGAIQWAQCLIERDACAEEAYRVVMAAYYRQGDRPMALRTYDRCVIALDDELGVDPMPETQLLFDRITRLVPLTPDALD